MLLLYLSLYFLTILVDYPYKKSKKSSQRHVSMGRHPFPCHWILFTTSLARFFRDSADIIMWSSHERAKGVTAEPHCSHNSLSSSRVSRRTVAVLISASVRRFSMRISSSLASAFGVGWLCPDMTATWLRLRSTSAGCTSASFVAPEGISASVPLPHIHKNTRSCESLVHDGITSRSWTVLQVGCQAAWETAMG